MYKVCIQKADGEFEDYSLDDNFENIDKNFQKACLYKCFFGTSRTIDVFCVETVEGQLVLEYFRGSDGHLLGTPFLFLLNDKNLTNLESLIKVLNLWKDSESGTDFINKVANLRYIK